MNLDLEIWEKGRLETNHGVKIVGDYNDGSRDDISKHIYIYSNFDGKIRICYNLGKEIL